MSSPESEFSVRIVTCDSYLAKPLEGYDQVHSDIFRERAWRVPILRIFGSTPAGQTACVHIHGVYPYLYIPYDGSQPTAEYLRFLAKNLNNAINQHNYNPQQAGADREFYGEEKYDSRQHVYKMSIIKGIPFYGYYQNEHMFVKIFFYSPQSARIASRLLLNGAVLRKSFQPYEAHIPFVLQFFMDFNLQGMNYLNASRVRFRKPRSDNEKYERSQFRKSDQHLLSQMTASTTFHIPSTNVFVDVPQGSQSGLPRTTICELEADVLADDVLNREEIEIKIGTNPGLAAIWREENQRRAMRGHSPLDGIPQSQERTEFIPTRSEEFYFKKLETKLKDVVYKKQDNLDAEVAATLADLVDNVEVMFRDKVLFGLSDTTIVGLPDEINSSFYMERRSQSQRSSSKAGPSSGINVSEVLSTIDEDDLADLLNDLDASENQAEANDGEDQVRPGTPVLFDDVDGAELALENEMNKSVAELSVLTPPMDFGEDAPSPYVSQKVDPELEDDSWVPCNQLQESRVGVSASDIEDIVTPAKKARKERRPTERKAAVEVNRTPTLLRPRSDHMLGSPLNASTPVGRPKKKPPGTKKVRFNIEDGKSNLAVTQSVPSTNPDRLTLTPAIPFPSYTEVVETAHLYGLSRHVGHRTYVSSIEALAAEKLVDPRSRKRKLADLPYRPLKEFVSNLVPFDSTSRFREAKEQCAGFGKRFDDQNRKSRLTKSKKASSKTVTEVEPPGIKWKVTLTPALPFPNLSAVIKMQKKLNTASNRAEDETQNATADVFAPISDPSQPTASVVQAKKNPQFRALLENEMDLELSVETKADEKKGKSAENQVPIDPENLMVMALEIHADVNDSFHPDPQVHPIRFLCFTLMSDTGEEPFDGYTCCFYLDENCQKEDRRAQLEKDVNRFSCWLIQRVKLKSLEIEFFASEEELLKGFCERVRSLDPDILIGYEIQMASWGYLIDRAEFYGLQLEKMMSRFLKPPGVSNVKRMPTVANAWEARKMSEIHIVGRVILNLWRLIRHEVNLSIYTFENVVFNVLNHRLFRYPTDTLTQWLKEDVGSSVRWRAMEYLILKTTLSTALMAKIDLIRQTSEFSRMYGIQFYDTLTRGSQFRVESMMLRLAKPFNFVPVTPSGEQLIQMQAPECLPLIFEPESRMYYDPVVVLDFQSLYPSMIIAYNYCFSTCLGRVNSLGNEDYFKFGCTSYHVPPYILKKHLKDINFSPTGIAFVRETVRKGILPKMLEEILNTRIMVKKSMAEYKSDPNLKKMLHARQLGLKLIANVTYGYTSATFSGRMPCVEIGDSIVSKARETLERAIKFVESHPKWSARIVYGDTDSMFVVLRGRSKEEAFRIGKEIEKAVTDMNPKPVKLKFEKVYLPCILQTKKRYVGYMYESVDQAEPVFDAKGIETVRRDGCEVVSKTLEEVIRMLFTDNLDIVDLRKHVEDRFQKVLTGDISMKELIFAKEYRGREYYKPGARVPALEIARKATKINPRAEPRSGERVPYIVTYGDPREILINLVRQPHEILRNPSLRPHGYYYCSRQLAPVLNRVLLLVGLDCRHWLFEVMKRLAKDGPNSAVVNLSTDLVYFRKFCAEALMVGGGPFFNDAELEMEPAIQKTAKYFAKVSELQKKQGILSKVCQRCMGTCGPNMECQAFDCPVLYERFQVLDRLSRLSIIKSMGDEVANRLMSS